MLATESAAAQVISPGQRVRIIQATDTVVGVVDSVRQQQIWLRSPRSEGIPVGKIQRVDLSQGRKPPLGKGAAYGALGGALVGGALWLAFINGDPYEEMKGMWAAVFIGSGVAGGALAGMGLSVALARERWEVVPPDRWSARWLFAVRFALRE